MPPRNMTEPECLLFKMRWWLGRFVGEQAKPKPDLAFMERCLDKAQEAAVASAPYHHARLSAVMVGAAINKIEVTGGMPDEFAPPVPGRVEFEPGMVISAEDEVGDKRVVNGEIVPFPGTPKEAAG